MAEPQATSTPTFEQMRGMTLDLLTQNTNWLIKIRREANSWNEHRASNDADAHYSVEVVAETLEALRTRQYSTLAAFSYDLGKMASIISLAKASYSRENADYWYALSYTNAAFLVMLDMLELAENPQ